MLLYHGSSVLIVRPLAELNTGFSDLGRGFYCTDNYEVALSRARARARKDGSSDGVVSAFSFDEQSLPWVALGDDEEPAATVTPPFGLRFAPNRAGFLAWATYIKACRKGNTAVEGLGEPTVVRAWIATEVVEMMCAGVVDAEELVDYIDPSELVVQYCFRDQLFLDEYVSPCGLERP